MPETTAFILDRKPLSLYNRSETDRLCVEFATYLKVQWFFSNHKQENLKLMFWFQYYNKKRHFIFARRKEVKMEAIWQKKSIF